MDKITSKTLEIEEPLVDAQSMPIDDVFWVETSSVGITARMPSLTPIIYDDEIGLWEELEHRNRLADTQSK